MQIQAPYVGAGLITIERDHVYAWQWFKTTTTSSVQKIKVPQGLEGNGYVSVSFVRDPSLGGDLHRAALLRRAAVLDCPRRAAQRTRAACAGAGQARR